MEKARNVAEERREAEKALQRANLRAGFVAEELIEGGRSAAAVARALGVSPPHVRTLVARARESGLGGVDEMSDIRVPVLNGEDAIAHLTEGGARITRAIGAFDAFDALYRCGLDPSAFRSGLDLMVTNLLLANDAGDWAAVEDANVGYGNSTGPRNAETYLLEAGFPSDVAALSLSHRFFEYDATRGLRDDRHRRGLFGVGRPSFVGDALVVRISCCNLPGTRRSEDTLEPEFGRWLNVIDFLYPDAVEPTAEPMVEPPAGPAWLRGPRVARVFLTTEAAMTQGFTENLDPEPRRMAEGPYHVIVEQGRLQLWLPVYPPARRTELFSSEALEALQMADVLPHAHRLDGPGTAGPAARLLSYVDRYVRSRRAWFDVSESGTEELVRVPLPPAEGSV